jgi:hypothetical protein
MHAPDVADLAGSNARGIASSASLQRARGPHSRLLRCGNASEERGHATPAGYAAPHGTGRRAGPRGTLTVEAAAKVLDRTPGRVRQLLRSGDLEGEHEGGDASKPWGVYGWSVHAYRDAERGGARGPGGDGQESTRGARMPPDGPGHGRTQRELGRLEGRLELTAQAKSTAREDLERERARADEERNRADAERERAEARAEGGAVEGVLGPAVRGLTRAIVFFRFEGNPRPVSVSETHPMHAFGNTLIKGPDAPSSGCPTRPRRWHLLHVRGEPHGGGDAAAGGAGTLPPACGKAGPLAPTILPAPLPATGIRYRRSPVLLAP